MINETFTFKSKDNIDIFVYKWLPETHIKGVVQIAHGVCEHAGRYDYFAQKLTEQGYVVFANDHRGHGKTAKTYENLIYLGENGWNRMVADTYHLTRIIKKLHPGMPVFFFGHSMGSFVLRQYLYEYPNRINGAILSGSGHYDPLILNAGILIASRLIERDGSKRRSFYLNKMVFENFNEKVSDPETLFDWLSRDKNAIKKYLADPKCGIPCTNNLFYELLSGLKELQKAKNIVKIPKNTPILLISGDKDPVGHWGKDISILLQLYKKNGIKDVKALLFKEARHELINEQNRDQIILRIITWINSHNFSASKT
ncbi:MAG: alpha/beta hydrolase [Clostridiaceae bacterium]|nr:alpha/beta hydrolase [Clostridiaceae bacterium]